MMVYAAEKKKRVVIAVVNKATTDEKLGINLIKVKSGRFRVGPLSPTSPFQHTELREGMEVKTINGVEVEGKEMPSVMGILKNCVGRIIIAAETDKLPSPAVPKKRRSVVAVVNKISQEEKLGINVQKLTTGGFVVGSLTPTSPFQHTELRAGMEIKSINGVEVKGKEMSCVMGILKNFVGSIIVIAETHELPSAVAPKKRRSVVAVVNKASEGDKLGINVQELTTGGFQVGSLTPTSPFQQTELRAGMEIKSINGVDLKGRDMPSVMVILRKCIGSIIIIAETDDTPSYATTDNAPAANANLATKTTKIPLRRTIAAAVNKATADEKLGIQLVRTADGDFFVSMISPESMFKQTELGEGMRVVSINGVDLDNKDMEFVMAILSGAVGTIILAAETEQDASTVSTDLSC